MRNLIIIALSLVLGVSCVSTKKFNSVRADALRYENEYARNKAQAEELKARNAMLAQQLEGLVADTAQLNLQQRELSDKYKNLLSSGSTEAGKMIRQLEENQRELDARSQKVEELQNLLKAREQAIDDIRRKVADALLGFEGKGLSISTHEGKVYVSMDDKLLFRSGSFDIDPNGAQAIKELGSVLAANPDINIMVEGHTDNVPYKPNGNLRDNLDLSAKRATTVARLLLENKGIEASRIISAGRGESLPVDRGTTNEARAKNRRTEIILSPKLDELLSLMDK